MKKKFRFLVAILACVVLCSFATLSILASDDGNISVLSESSDNITWTLSDGGVLTIGGTGAMSDYAGKGAPWYINHSDIKSVVVESGVTSIGKYAFYYCENLESVTLPDSVTSIGDWAFWGCDSLTDVSIGSGVNSIGKWVFAYCKSLTDIEVSAENGSFRSVDGVLYDKDMTKLICYPALKSGTAFTVPSSVKTIGSYAFYKAENLKTVIIPDSVTYIDNYVFYGCNGISSIDISANVNVIGNWTFAACDNLSAINVAGGNKKYASVSGVLYNKAKDTLLAYPAGKADVTFTVPNSVTSIGRGAFEGSNNLKTVVMGQQVTSIGYSAFAYCDNLSVINYSSSAAEWSLIKKGLYWNRYTDYTVKTTQTDVYVITSTPWQRYDNGSTAPASNVGVQLLEDGVPSGDVYYIPTSKLGIADADVENYFFRSVTFINFDTSTGEFEKAVIGDAPKTVFNDEVTNDLSELTIDGIEYVPFSSTNDKTPVNELVINNVLTIGTNGSDAMSATALNNKAFALNLYDDNGDAVYDRAVYNPIFMGVHYTWYLSDGTTECDGIIKSLYNNLLPYGVQGELDGQDGMASIKYTNPAAKVNGAVSVYSYNPQSMVVTVYEVLAKKTGTIQSYNYIGKDNPILKITVDGKVYKVNHLDGNLQNYWDNGSDIIGVSPAELGAYVITTDNALYPGSLGINDVATEAFFEPFKSYGSAASRLLYPISAARTISYYAYGDYIIMADVADASGVTTTDTTTVPLSIVASQPSGNLLSNGSFNVSSCLSSWDEGTNDLHFVTDSNGGYLKTGNITISHIGFNYTPETTIGAGNYRFRGYVRTADLGAQTQLRVIFYDKSGKATTNYVNIRSNEWTLIDTYVTVEEQLTSIAVLGGPYSEYIQDYCMDEFSLEAVNSVPSEINTTFGETVPAWLAEVSYPYNIIDNDTRYYRNAEEYEVKGIYFNADPNFFFNIPAVQTCNAQYVRDYANMFRDTHVTDFVMQLNADIAFYDSNVWDDVIDRYNVTKENGIDVNYKGNQDVKAAYHVIKELGVDHIAVWIEEVKKVGITPWISFRMNDGHGLMEAATKGTYSIVGSWFHNNDEYRRVQNGVRFNNYFSYHSDYTFAEVRQHKLDLINEALNRYDAYGIELDWQRDSWLFYTGGEYNGLDVINDFMRDVEALVAQYEKKWGHEIKIGVIVKPDIQNNYDFGLDVMTWVSEGIVDRVTPKNRHPSTNNLMPIESWAELLAPYNVELSPCAEHNLRSIHDNNSDSLLKLQDLLTYSGSMASFFSQGADKVYVYNFFLDTILKDSDRIISEDNRVYFAGTQGFHNILVTVGSYEKLMDRDRQIVLDYSDEQKLWAPIDMQLPRTLTANGESVFLRLPVGDIPEGSKVSIKISTSAGEMSAADRPTVKVNGETCTFTGFGSNKALTTYTLLCYDVPASAHDGMYVVAEITPKAGFTINHAEVFIDDPENAVAPEKETFTSNVTVETAPKVSPADLDKSDVQGIVIRAKSSEINVARLKNTQVKECIITVDTYAANVVSALKAAGIKTYISVDCSKGISVDAIKTALNAYGADGVDLDFVTGGIQYRAVNESYKGFAYTNNLMANVRNELGDDVLISVTVPSDVSVNEMIGLSPIRWAQNGFVDMICPSVGANTSDLDIPVRLWYSLLEPYDVVLAPTIGDFIKVNESSSNITHTDATLAAEAASFLAKGADRVSVAYPKATDASLNVIGSYSAATAADRTYITTYTAVRAPWQVSDAVYPKTLSGSTLYYVPVGDIPAGKTAYVCFTTQSTMGFLNDIDTVYANSKECTYLRYSGTEAEYKIPSDVYNSGHFVFEVVGSGQAVVKVEVTIK